MAHQAEASSSLRLIKLKQVTIDNSSLRLIKLRQVIFWGNKGWFIRAALPFFEGDRIRINPIWIDYLIVHRNILKGFTIHKLNCFLARRNPNFMLPMEMTGNPRYSFYSEHFTKS